MSPPQYTQQADIPEGDPTSSLHTATPTEEDILRQKLKAAPSYEQVNFFDRFFLRYLNPLSKLGTKYNLTVDDVPAAPEKNHTINTVPQFNQHYAKQIHTTQQRNEEHYFQQHARDINHNDAPLPLPIKNNMKTYEQYQQVEALQHGRQVTTTRCQL